MKTSILKVICITFLLSTSSIAGQINSWSVNSADYSLDASMIAEIFIDDTISNDTEDIIGVFDEYNIVRGVAKPTYVSALNKQIVFLSLSGNIGGEYFTFKVFDASENKVVNVPNTKIQFIPGNTIGNISEPFVVRGNASVLPTVHTFSASQITPNLATLLGEVSDEGNSVLTEKGFLYSSEITFPTLESANTTKHNSGTIIGEFTTSISGINTSKTIYYRTYATNNLGVSYGEVKRLSLNNALNFDQVDDVVSIPDNAAFNFTNGFSVDVLVYPTNIAKSATIISQFENNQKAFSLEINFGGTLTSTISVDGTTEVSQTTIEGLQINKWQHLTLTYTNSGEMAIYINGNLTRTKSKSGTATGSIFNSTASIQIGAKNNTNFFKGNIDECRIWSTTLSQTLITAIQHKKVPNSIAGLVANYSCNQGTANENNATITKLTDTSGNNLNGTLVGFAKNGSTSNFIANTSTNFDNTTFAKNTFTTSGNWSDTNNWTFNQIPTQLDNVTIAENQTITIDVDNLQIDNFELQSNATLIIPTDKEITINNEFVSNGNLVLNSDANSSGVLLINGSSTGTITYTRGGLLANKWSIVTPPISGQTVKSFAENSANDIRTNTTVSPIRYAIGYYDDSQTAGNKWQYYNENTDANVTFTAGESYSISRASNGSVSFTGTLATNSVNKKIASDQWVAVGNPYTTYFPANKNSNSSFLTDNFDNLDDAYKSIYVWDNLQNKYVAISNASISEKSLAPGQGFFVRTKSTANTITFSKEKRQVQPTSTVFSKSATYKKSLQITKDSYIKLAINNEKNTISTLINYSKNATKSLDIGLDIANFEASDLDIFSKLINDENTENFTIQSVGDSDFNNTVIPIGIKAKANEKIVFTIENYKLPEGIAIYLEDKLAQTFTQLNDNSYKITINEDTNATGRFYLHTISTVLNTITNKTETISMYVKQKELYINNLQEQVSLKIYSMVGKEVFNQKLENSNNQEVSLTTLVEGIYFVDITSNNKRYFKKIILN